MGEETLNYLKIIKEQTFFQDEETLGSLKHSINWYQTNAKKSHFWFRIVGFLVIFISISVPFVVALWPGSGTRLGVTQGQVAAILSWLLALAGGANGFFQWGRTWQSRIEAWLRLERLRVEWEIAVNNPKATLDQIISATQKLVTDARETIKLETGVFFEEIQFPEIEQEN